MFVRLSVGYAFGVLSITYVPHNQYRRKQKIYHNVGTVPISNRKIIEISLKCKYKVSDHKKRSVLIWGCCHFFRSGVMPKYLRLT
jgi:hypothetical protein